MTVIDSMSRCGCGCAILKTDGEPTIVALQEAVENSRQRYEVESSAGQHVLLPWPAMHAGVIITRYKMAS